MKINERLQRRQILKFGVGAFAIFPVLLVSNQIDAATNANMRAALKYQSKPEGDKNCANCIQFVPGKTAQDLGSCKVLPGDTEISPQGYCTVWSKKP